MYTIIMREKILVTTPVKKKRNIYFVTELSLREISFVVYAHALICAANDTEIGGSRVAQSSTEESP